MIALPAPAAALLSSLTPFVVATRRHAALLDLAPCGVQVEPAHVVDPQRLASAAFLRRLADLDRLTFGPEGMPMPGWVFYDAAAVPGAVFGFGRRGRDLPADVRAAMAVEDDAALVPLSMYIAIPVRPPRAWFGHNLASLAGAFPSLGLKGLATMTKALALACFRCEVQIGATQWDSPALPIHARFGPLDLLTAWTPAHAESGTLTYRLDVTGARLQAALGGAAAAVAPLPIDVVIDAHDAPAMQALQVRLEAGLRFCIAGPPTGRGASMRTPIARLP